MRSILNTFRSISDGQTAFRGLYRTSYNFAEGARPTLAGPPWTADTGQGLLIASAPEPVPGPLRLHPPDSRRLSRFFFNIYIYMSTSLQTGVIWVSVQVPTSGTTLKVGQTAVSFLLKKYLVCRILGE